MTRAVSKIPSYRSYCPAWSGWWPTKRLADPERLWRASTSDEYMSNTTAQPVLSISHGFSSGCSSSLLTGDSHSRDCQGTYRFTLTPGAIVYRDMSSLQRPVQACFAERRTKLAIDLCGHADCFFGLLIGHIGELWLSGAHRKAPSAVPDVGERPAQFSAGVIFRQRGHGLLHTSFLHTRRTLALCGRAFTLFKTAHIRALRAGISEGEGVPKT